MATTVQMTYCTELDELHRHYDGQTEPQPAYIELDLEDGRMLADYDAEIGGARPMSVFLGIQRRYRIPLLTKNAANELMDQLKPLADRILSDAEVEWDGSNHRGVLGEDAAAAEQEIEDACAAAFDDEDSHLAVWDAEDWIGGAGIGSFVDEWDITADTTDDLCKAIAAKELERAREDFGPDLIIPDLDAAVTRVRDDLRADQADED